MRPGHAHSSVPVHDAILGEDGAVLVWVAIMLPVIVLLMAFVIDVGNWFAHHRHLQTQADAAALAGALEWGKCFGDQDVANAAIDAAARQYSGEADGSYNEQIGGTSRDHIHYALNSATYEPKPDNPGPRDDTVVAAQPCEAGMVDVKMTETDLPLFIRAVGLFSDVDYINTHARVQIFQRERFKDAMPFGVPDPNPSVGRVIFVDEANLDANGKPTVLGSAPLTKQKDPSGGLAIWDNSAAPFALPVNSAHIGVRVAFGGATSTNCGDPLVDCFPADPPNPNGLLHVRGYSTGGSGAQPNQPLARSVRLTNATGGCTDPYFVNTTTACGIGVSAQVDFGNFGSCGQLTAAVGPKLTARRAGSNTDYPLSCTMAGSTIVWQLTGAPIPVNPHEGPVDIELRWEETKGSLNGGIGTCSNRGNNPCKGSFGNVQRTFSAGDDRTGPIRLAQLWENGATGANSLAQCQPPDPGPCHAVVARIGTDLNLENAKSVSDPLVTLRFAASSGSQNQALDCDPAVANFRDEIALGCGPTYERNQGTACPATNTTLWALPQPWDCVALEPGDKTGQIAQGMNLRVHGDASPSQCVSPNNWEENFPDFTGDPRAVDLFLTPYGAFSGSGSGTVPVTGFAKFYVTGWHNSDQVCPGDDPSPDKSVVGHFISYLESFNDGTAGDEPCDPAQLGSCVPVMTK